MYLSLIRPRVMVVFPVLSLLASAAVANSPPVASLGTARLSAPFNSLDEHDRPVGSYDCPLNYGPDALPLLPAPTTAAPEASFAPLPLSDGESVSLDWVRVIFGTGIGATGLHIVDLDGDGANEIVAAAAQSGFAANSYWYVLSYSGGTYNMEWVGPQYPEAIGAIRVASLDGEPGLKLIVAHGNIIDVYDGSTRELLSSFSTACAAIRELVTDDVDSDGAPEFVICGSNGTYVYSAVSGGLEWNGSAYAAYDVAVGNVDADAAHEIIIANGDGAPGYVLNGATHAVEWTYPSGFGAYVRVADLDGDGMDEIAAGHSWYEIVVFDADVHSPKYDIPVDLDLDALQLADVEGDGPIELIYGDGQWGAVYVHDGATGALKWPINNPEHGVTDIAVGDSDGDGVIELAWGAGYSSTGPDYLFIADTQTHQREWQSTDIGGPFYALDAGDVDADGRSELLYGCFESESGYADGLWFVHDGETKALEFTSPEPTGLNWTGLWRIRHANLDADPQAEIIITTSVTYSGRLICYDGLTHAEQWHADLPDGNTFRALALADVDADGVLEAVTGEYREHTGASGTRLRVFNAQTGAQEWQSVSLGTYWASLSLLRVANVDEDPNLEMLIAEYGGQLFIYDGVTKIEELQTFDLDITALGTFDLDGDGVGEIMIGTSGGAVQVLNPETGAVDATLVESEGAIDGLAFGPDFMAFCTNGELFLYTLDGALIWRSGVIGAYAGSNDSLMLTDIDDDGRLEIAVNLGVRGIAVYSIDSPGLGDLDCSGTVDGYDIDPFVLALTDPAGYAAAFPDCEISRADINEDGSINGYDIDAFVRLLTGGPR